jgi:hypothetical protein
MIEMEEEKYEDQIYHKVRFVSNWTEGESERRLKSSE